MATSARNAFYAQSGGVTAVINASAAGVIETAARHPQHIGQVFERVRALLRHRDFTLANPNRVRSLIGAFCMSNPAAFHRSDAGGYHFWADRVLELDSANPQMAARIARVMDRWTKLAEPYRSGARDAINRVAARTDLSSDLREIITRALTGK